MIPRINVNVLFKYTVIFYLLLDNSIHSCAVCADAQIQIQLGSVLRHVLALQLENFFITSSSKHQFMGFLVFLLLFRSLQNKFLMKKEG